MSVKDLLAITDEIERFDAVCMPALLAPSLSQEQKTEETRIVACDSRLWCVIEVINGNIHIQPDSDSLWVKGLALLIKEEVERYTLSELAIGAVQISETLYARGIIDEKRRQGMREIERRIMLCAGEYIKKCSR